MWTTCCLKKAKNQQSSFFCDLPRGQGKIFNDKILLEEFRKRVRIAHRKMRSAQRYTARDKRNTQKLEKQSEICAPLRLVMVVADFHVADRVKISTCSLLVLGGLFATFLSGGAGQGRRNSLAAYFFVYPSAI